MLAYIFQRLDSIVSSLFSFEHNELVGKNVTYLLNEINVEKENIMSMINNRAFSYNNDNDIEYFIFQCRSSLKILSDTLQKRKITHCNLDNSIQEVHDALLVCIDEIFTFLETRFSKFISLDEILPDIYLDKCKQELKTKIISIEQTLYRDSLTRLLLERLKTFVNTNIYPFEPTLRAVKYKQELVQRLEEIKRESPSDPFSPIEQLLIYLNFNSKKFIDILTDRLAKEINQHETSTERMAKILYYFKAYKQLYRKPNVKLNPRYHDLDFVINNWFTQEIIYIEKKLRLSVIPLQYEKTKNSNYGTKSHQSIHKVLCMLSIDQLGLILRAADDLRVIHAKSLNEVFKTIVPYLSTPYKEELSSGSMRAKSYSPEERDKQVAIETLERIIIKIKEY